MQSENNIIIFPYAGGDARSLHNLGKLLEGNVHIIEYSGHGKRLSEVLFTSYSPFFEDICRMVNKTYESCEKLILIGYSLGALVAYDYYTKYPERVSKLILCSRQSPTSSIKEERRGMLSNEELKNEVLLMGGTDSQLLMNKDFEFYLDIIRSDFQIVDSYKVINSDIRFITCPLQINVGLNDIDFTLRQANQWIELMDDSKHCQINIFKKGHFFFKENLHAFSDCINRFINNN